ncbi:MAG: TIGR02206 family membrane protein [Verrucomicrobiota bacterium]
MPRPFHPFTNEHFIALGVGAVVAAIFLFAGKRGGGGRKRATAVLALINLGVYPLSLGAWLSMDVAKSWDNLLPFHLCDVAAITAGLALITKRPLLCALTYFWGLAATIQGLITPAITVGFPAPPFLMFFVHHFAVVIAALYIPIVDGWRPKLPWWKSPLEVLGWSVLYLFFAMTVNRLLGSNFAFASRPPDNPSLIDHLGPWPWYLVAMLGLAATFYSLLALPFARRVKEGGTTAHPGRPKSDPP